MNYKLASELKNAGFPQSTETRNVGPGEPIPTPGVRLILDPSGESVYIPTLSELIEACGEGFWQLQRIGEESLGVKWLAYEHNRAGQPFVSYAEYTPEEAVARLWLALNKKHVGG